MHIKIRQFGGHKGSYAGDCALIEIDAGPDSQVIVIDTGADKVWAHGDEFRQRVTGGLQHRAHVPRTLITTHFHADHYSESRVSQVEWDHWFHGEKIGGTPADGTRVIGNQRVLTGTEAGGANPFSFFVDCWAPDWTGATPLDENDLSLAVAVYASNGLGGFSFLSFGDMTKAAESRMTRPFFPVDVAKFPHHGSYVDNYLKYFDYGVCDHVLMSGDSGSAVESVKALQAVDPVPSVSMLVRTPDAAEQFKHAWETACKVNPDYNSANVAVGGDMVLTWESGESEWGDQATLAHDGCLYLRVRTRKVSSRRSETGLVWGGIDDV